MLEKLKKEILESSAPVGIPVRFVAIDGHGGSGKTTLAEILAKELEAEVLHTDDFASYDKPMDWWTRLVSEVFDPIIKGADTLSYKRGAWYKDHKPEPVVDQPITSIIILEGVSSSRSEFRKYLAYSIWVETPLKECARRGIYRDLSDNEAGKTQAQIKADWDKWHAYELEYVAKDNPREYVDLIVDGTKRYN